MLDLTQTSSAPLSCSASQLSDMKCAVQPMLRGSIAGFDAAVREANSSPAGRRNGGAMLLALASEKALLTTLVRLASAENASDAASLRHPPAQVRTWPAFCIPCATALAASEVQVVVKCPVVLPEVWTLALRAQVNRLAHLDADALVGHNISAFDLDILLHRLEKHKARLIRCSSTFATNTDPSKITPGLWQRK